MRTSRVEIDLNALRNNIRALQLAIGEDKDIVFVIKSDAYGHGAFRIAQCATEEGVRWFAVAHVYEALEVRRAAPDADILIMGGAFPEDAAQLITHSLTPVLLDPEYAFQLNRKAQEAGGTVRAHIKLDSGMGRLGFLPEQITEELFCLSNIKITGLCSHFATVEPSKLGSARHQLNVYADTVKKVEAWNKGPLFKHLSNTRAVQYLDESDYDGVRPGMLLYGYPQGPRVETQPILQWKTRLIQVKTLPPDSPIGYYGSYRTSAETDIGVVGLGYAEGFSRSMSNRGYVLVGGRRCDVVGRISMNWITVDLGSDSGAKAGDEVVIVGTQGSGSVWADEIGEWAGTIAYEVLVSIHPAVERVYLEK